MQTNPNMQLMPGGQAEPMPGGGRAGRLVKFSRGGPGKESNYTNMSMAPKIKLYQLI